MAWIKKQTFENPFSVPPKQRKPRHPIIPSSYYIINPCGLIHVTCMKSIPQGTNDDPSHPPIHPKNKKEKKPASKEGRKKRITQAPYLAPNNQEKKETEKKKIQQDPATSCKTFTLESEKEKVSPHKIKKKRRMQTDRRNPEHDMNTILRF
jgi:hypothetical protein